MIFRQITPQRFRVLKHEGDTKFRGIVEKQTFRDEKGITRTWWFARAADGGWRTTNKGHYATRQEAAEALFDENKEAYGNKRMSWKQKQGTTAEIKQAKKGRKAA